MATQTKPVPELVSRNDGSNPRAYLSHSRVSKYLMCPEQYRLYYVENFRPKVPSASLEFGQAIHSSLASAFLEGHYAVSEFIKRWDAVKGTKLRYPFRESWGRLRERGIALLEEFMQGHFDRLTNVQACESDFELKVSNLDVPFVGVIDLVAELDGKLTVVDFKTSGSKYQGFEAALSDQLSAYLLAEPQAQQTALCVLVKTAEPKIEWFVSNRSGADLTSYLQKVSLVGHQITGRQFYKRPGKWCAYCDFLPICLGDHERAKETLVQAE